MSKHNNNKNHQTSEENFKLSDNATTKLAKTRGNDWETADHTTSKRAHTTANGIKTTAKQLR